MTVGSEAVVLGERMPIVDIGFEVRPAGRLANLLQLVLKHLPVSYLFPSL